MSGLKSVTLGELTWNRDAARRPIRGADREFGDTPYLGASGVVDRVKGFTHDGHFLMVAEDGENLRSRSTPIAWTTSGRIWANNHVHVLEPRLGFDGPFLQHLLSITDISGYLTGSTLPKLTQFALARIALRIPPPRERERIAEVLGALDDKIAANEAPNGSVERLLRAHLARLSDLPSAGPRAISELIDFNPRCSAPLDPITFVDMNKLPTADSVIRDWGSRPAVAGGARFMNGDTLLARITPCLENRKTGFVDFLEAGEVGVGSTEFVVMRSRRGIAKPVSYLLATDEGFRTHAALHMTGTSGRQRVAAADLAKYEMLLPPDEGFRELGELATALFTRLAQARDENRTLAALRDTLLPELMAGRLTVKDAEHAVEEAL